MPDYVAVGVARDGSRRNMKVNGCDPSTVRARMRAQGIFVERLAPAGPTRWFRRWARISSTHQVLLFQQMQMLLSSGILISDGLRHLRDCFPDERTRRILSEIHDEIAESRTGLSSALARFPRTFSPAVIAVIEAGEQGGAALLAERFGDLAERVAFEEAHRRRIRRACAYPAFVVGLALALYAVLLGVVFPRLAELLASMGSSLPPLTRAVIAAAADFRRGWLPATIAAAAGAAGIAWLRRVPSSARILDRLLLRIPLAGGVYRDSSVALICKIYRSLYLANQPAPAIVDLCTNLVGNRAIRQALADVKERITHEGATLSAALSLTGIFPPIACLAIEVGEQSGKLAEALDRVSAHFGAQARERLDAAIAVINPVLTLAVVAGAGLILLSFFQAAYQVTYATR